MLGLIDHLREQIKLTSNRSEKIRQLSAELLSLADEIFSDPEYQETNNKLYNLITEYIGDDDDDLQILATNINSDDHPCFVDYSELLEELDYYSRLGPIEYFGFTVDESKGVLFIKILLLLLDFSYDEDYSTDITHEKVWDHLRNECTCHSDIWRCSIYGSGWDDGTKEEDKYTKAHDAFSIEARRITDSLLSLNYCGTSPRLSTEFCSNCQTNFVKVKYFLDRDELHILAEDWLSAYEEVELETIKRPQTEAEFLERYPECGHLVALSKERANTALICKLDDYFDGDLTPKLEEIRKKDILNIGWYFRGDLTPLMSCPNLKGLVLGHWFNGSLDVLKGHPSLQFIDVRPSYNYRITEDVYKITFC